MKQLIKRLLPNRLHWLYNRIVSRKKIAALHGDWFELEWKREADVADAERWKKVYDTSWEHWSQPDLSPDDVARIVELIPVNASVLDAGCGDGYLLEAIREKTVNISGVDLSEKALTLARKRLGNEVPLRSAFLEKLPYRDGEFDVVVSAHTLEHVKEFEQAVAELRRVCKHRLIILVPSQEYLPYTEDYHLHFFPHESDLRQRTGLPASKIERYVVPAGICAYTGDVLLLVHDFN